MAFVALLMAYYRQSKRRTAEFLGTLLGQPCCPALTVKIQNQVTAALRPSYEELAAELPTQEQLNIDETANQGRKRQGVAVDVRGPSCSRCSRCAPPARPRRSAFSWARSSSGVVTCDRAKMYWQVGRLQWCWAHLKRDFQAMIDSGDKRAKWLGRTPAAATCELFEHWADYRHGKISRAALVRRMGPIRRKVERLLLRGTQCGHADVRGTCRELYEHRQWLWTFLRHEGVEPTNNAGERVVASCGDLAEAVVRHAERGRQPLCRDDVDGDRDLPPTAPQHLRLSDRRSRSSSESPTCPLIAPQGVNGYLDERQVRPSKDTRYDYEKTARRITLDSEKHTYKAEKFPAYFPTSADS